MKIDQKPGKICEHRSEQCVGCPHAQGCHLRCCETRYEYEAVVTTKLIAHKIMGRRQCRMTGKPVTGTFPAAITGTLVYAGETGNQSWATELRKLLQTMCHRWKVLQEENLTAFPEEELKGYLERYQRNRQSDVPR